MVRRILKRAIRLAYDAYRTVRPKKQAPPAPEPVPAPAPVPVAAAEVERADEEAALDAEVEAVIAAQAAAEAAAPVPEPVSEPEPAPEPEPQPKVKVQVWSEPTPNPNAMKFQANIKVVEKGSLSFTSHESASKHPLGKAIFEVPGVRVVFAVNDFVTVTKDREADWGSLAPQLEEVIEVALAG